MKRSEEKVPTSIACENPTCTIRPVCRRGQSDDPDARLHITKSWDGLAPICPIQKRPPFFSRDLLAIGPQPWAALTADDSIVQGLDFHFPVDIVASGVNIFSMSLQNSLQSIVAISLLIAASAFGDDPNKQNPLAAPKNASANPLAQPGKSQNPLAQPSNQPPSNQSNPLARQQQPSSQQPKPGPQAAGSVMKFTRLSIHDPGINNIEACSFLIPAGWKADGGIQWFPNMSILANLLMKVTDPQTGTTIEFLPMQNFTYITNPTIPMQQGTNYMGNLVGNPPRNIPEFVQTWYLPQAMPQLRQARIVGGEDLPKVSQLVAQAYGGQSTVKTSRVRYEYMVNGAPWQEDVFVTLVFTNWQMGTLWSVYSAYSVRAPNGLLDKMEPTAMATINSFRLSLDWYAGYLYVQKLFNNRQNQAIADARAISDTITRNSEEIRQMFSQAYKERSDSQDRIAQSVSESIRGVNTYSDPFEGRPIELPSGYNDAWVNARGEYLLSNTAGYDPNVGDTVEWRKMAQRGVDGR
jgi:hypothetical protein